MKKLTVGISLLMVLAIVPSTSVFAKGKPKSRVVTAAYQTPALGTPPYGPCTTQEPISSCVRVEPKPGETSVMIEVADSASSRVGFTVTQFPPPGSGVVSQGESLGAYCGDTGAPITIDPAMSVQVSAWLVGPPDCPEVATEGTITFTFMKRR